MSEVKWIKIVTDIFDDEKILLIESMPDADSIIVIWFKLLCLAGKNNNNGVFMLNGRIPYTDEMLATIFRRKVTTVRMALKTFEEFGMVEIINNTYTIPNWGKHQKLDALEAKTNYQREYMRNYREKQRQLVAGNANGNTNSETNSNTNVSETDKIRLEEDKSKNIKGAKAPRFTPPTVDEVREYAREKGYSPQEFDPEDFIDFYSSKGWMVGKSKMQNWHSSVSTWVRRYRKEHPAPDPEPTPGPYHDGLTDEERQRKIEEMNEAERRKEWGEDWFERYTKK